MICHLAMLANIVWICLILNFKYVTSSMNAFMQLSSQEEMHETSYFEIIEPEDLRYSYKIVFAKGFGSKFAKYFKEVRLVLPNPINLCSSPSNYRQLKGTVALVLRGGCSFMSKAYIAEKVGVIGVIITDNNINNDDQYLKMINDGTDKEVNIPAAFLLGISGSQIRVSLEKQNRNWAIINIPLNLSNVPLHKINQPRWVLW